MFIPPENVDVCVYGCVGGAIVPHLGLVGALCVVTGDMALPFLGEEKKGERAELPSPSYTTPLSHGCRQTGGGSERKRHLVT